jgi:hypothetical protein
VLAEARCEFAYAVNQAESNGAGGINIEDQLTDAQM